MPLPVSSSRPCARPAWGLRVSEGRGFLLGLILTAGVTAGAGVTDLRRETLVSGLPEPIAMDVARDGRVLIAGRKGDILTWHPEGRRLETNGVLRVFTGPEDGILGLALDPGFVGNGGFYLYRSTPGVPENRLVRRRLVDGRVLPDEEKVLLSVPTRIPKPNHSGGGVEFGGDGLLYLSTGDYTYADRSQGYAPLDRRPGQELNDSERTAANTDDLRGKILRIRPTPEGGYTIPSGNLFPPGTPRTRPEIYVMGCRNPFRFSVDAPTGRLFWGDVGPDAPSADPARGPAGLDEFHVTDHAANAGWPYFLADNRAYGLHDFASGTTGSAQDPAHPVNDSPNNTGRRELPPAEPAFLWYPPGLSARWPLLGSGARSAMAGPVYHHDPALRSPSALPRRFDGAVFLHEWERGWILAVWLDDRNRPTRMEPLVEGARFLRPIHLKLAPDGSLLVLEWGRNWSGNADAALTRVSGVPDAAP